MARLFALAVLPLAAAELRRTVEAFSSPAPFFVDYGKGFSPAFPDSGWINLTALAVETPSGDGAALRLAYSLEHMGAYGYGILGRILDGETFTQCAGATSIALRYRVHEPQSIFYGGGTRFALIDGSDCEGPACAIPIGLANEVYFSLSWNTDDTSGEWKEWRLGLCGSARPDLPFMRVSTFTRGNGWLDADAIRGFHLGIGTTAHMGLGNPTSGVIDYDDLSCIVPEPGDEPYDPCLPPTHDDVALVEGVVLPFAAAARYTWWGYRLCYERCANDDACLYYVVDTTLNLGVRPPIFPACWIFEEVNSDDVRPAGAPRPDDETVFEVFWVKDATKRGRLCDLCSCSGTKADCRGADLATVPAADGFAATELDLSGNPRLALIGPGAFGDELETLILPAGVAHVAPEALTELPKLRRVDVEAGAPRVRNFIADPSEFFEDRCCGLGAAAGGLRFCELVPDEIGVSDSYYEPSTENDAYMGNVYALIVPESPFRAEAAESLSKCAAFCDMIADCLSFSFRDLPAAVGYDRFCYLFDDVPDVAGRVPAGAPGDWVSGLPPRTRAAVLGATVAATPDAVELSKENGYEATISLRLGSTPRRGAVWVTPTAPEDGGYEISFEPARVVLYDVGGAANVTVRVTPPVPRTATLPLDFEVSACDDAFATQDLSVQLTVVKKDKSSNNKAARRVKRQATIAGIVVGVTLGVAGLIWFLYKVRRTAKKKRALELERTLVVQEQVVAAQERIREFQAQYAVLTGADFVALERLRPHEELRDKLIIFDKVTDVKNAMRHGEVFVFISHQWLGFADPDPNGVHLVAMRQAVQSVARDAKVPLERLRVWVDIVSIPQRNQSVQKSTIASLPTFASTCDYFVVVAPDTIHADTGSECTSRTYRSRTWCRAEIMSCWARNGVANMFFSTNDGLRPLAPSDDILVEALDVFAGDLTCCRLGHAHRAPCDREQLMLPILGLYSEIYRDRHGVASEAYGVLEPIKDRLFPKEFEWTNGDADAGETTTETHALFGDLVQATELSIRLDEADDDDPIWKQPVPDFRPGTTAQRRPINPHGARHGVRHAVSTKSLLSHGTTKKSMRMLRSRSNGESRSIASQSSYDDDGGDDRSVSSTAKPRRARAAGFAASDSSGSARPAMSRAVTWRASAPKMPAAAPPDAGDEA